MAKSKYEYVKNFEQDDTQLQQCWLVVRIDGRYFTRFTTEHGYIKPNDPRGLKLMNKCAENVMREFSDVCLAYGQSDEYSFVLHKNTTLFRRRASKIITNFVSLFASSFVFHWPEFFSLDEGDMKPTALKYPPTFDGRVVCYPTETILKDYLSWRQVDCHINNLYNTCFWSLVKAGSSPTAAEEELKGTLAAQKNEMLFSRFGINYNEIDPMYRKGSILLWRMVEVEVVRQDKVVTKKRRAVVAVFEDLIKPEFWEANPVLTK